MLELLRPKPRANGKADYTNFDAGKSTRRLRSVPTAEAAINSQIRKYGKTIVARSRYLAANNPYAAAAKETYVSALVGQGIKPSLLLRDEADIKDELEMLWDFWVEEADADGRADYYGLQQIVAAELFEGGECFVRFRPRRPEDGLSVPLQLEVLPAEMLPHDKNEARGGRSIEMGIEFDGIGRRTAYHFFRRHPNSDQMFGFVDSETVAVPAAQVLHIFRRVRAGQIRGIPHTLPSIARLAIHDQYEDAELERKRTAALFGVFVKRGIADQTQHPFASAETPAPDSDATGTANSPPAESWAMEPGAAIDLEEGEDVAFSEPADVGGNYEAFEYRNLLAIAAGFGVPYTAMTGDQRQTNYSSMRAGVIEFRRRIEAQQHRMMNFQLNRQVWRRWLREAVLASATSLTPAEFERRCPELCRVKWQPPRWEWVDPLKERQAEKLAVDEGFKARSDVIEAEGGNPEDTDARIARDQERAERLGLTFGAAPPPAAPPPDDEDEEEDEEDDDDDA